MKKKFITAAILSLSALLLVAASVLGTFAFFAASTAVSNTFTVGSVKINMLESKTNENGEDQDGENRTSDGNSYKLVPNKTYVKDPAIFVNADSVASYLFIKVKNGISTIEKQGDAEHLTMEQQMMANGWQLIKSNDAGEKLYLYVGKDNVVAGKVEGELPHGYIAVGNSSSVGGIVETYEIFNSFTVTDDITEAKLADYAGAKVTLTAFAIQTDTFTEKVGDLYGYQRAWNAIVNRFPFESGTAYGD
ncbi:MAG: hypothetical protein E7619_06225 [Ruminococcaceae bacterium]|nr:hypothetical protein [Oscillospiraceae bacterium]